jgi:hypothetical protein
MTQFSTALVSLLPVAGAVALTVHGLRRRMRADPRPPSASPPRPIEAPPATPRQARAPRPDGNCHACGTSVPPRTALCAVCERTEAGAGNSLRATALHWLVFVAAMTAIIGAGWLVSP